MTTNDGGHMTRRGWGKEAIYTIDRNLN
jgi:hypothetical protein